MEQISESGSSGDRQGEQELDSETLQIQAKRFYVDVKENRRGRFIKLAEVAAGRKKNRIILPMSIAGEFRNKLTELVRKNNELGPSVPAELPQDGKLESLQIVKDHRRYYIDLKENDRGRFVRVSLLNRGARSQIGIPAQGIVKVRDAFAKFVEKYGGEEEENEERVPFSGDNPEPRSIRVENKTFFFDIGQNNRGMYMKISEVKQNFRSSITIPERSWGKFRETIEAYMREVRTDPLGNRMNALSLDGPSSSSSNR